MKKLILIVTSAVVCFTLSGKDITLSFTDKQRIKKIAERVKSAEDSAMLANAMMISKKSSPLTIKPYVHRTSIKDNGHFRNKLLAVDAKKLVKWADKKNDGFMMLNDGGDKVLGFVYDKPTSSRLIALKKYLKDNTSDEKKTAQIYMMVDLPTSDIGIIAPDDALNIDDCSVIPDLISWHFLDWCTIEEMDAYIKYKENLMKPKIK